MKDLTLNKPNNNNNNVCQVLNISGKLIRDLKLSNVFRAGITEKSKKYYSKHQKKYL